MSWKPIVIGVDDSMVAQHAAAFAWRVAAAADTQCHLVHAIPNPWSELAAAEMVLDYEQLSRDLIDIERERLAQVLFPHVPPRLIADLDVRLGRSGPVLAAAAAEHDAGLLILGGKHHGMVGRWFGSTAHYAVRRADLPILITNPDIGDVRRVLIAADLSHAAAPTIAVAERFAALFEARVRALHVIEPLPPLATLDGSLTTYDFVERTEQTLQRETWPLLQSPNAEVLVRHGTPHVVIADVAREWNADVIVVGSHGRGWVDRMLLGSTTERLLNRLPASLLVVPVHSPTGGATFENATAMKESR